MGAAAAWGSCLFGLVSCTLASGRDELFDSGSSGAAGSENGLPALGSGGSQSGAPDLGAAENEAPGGVPGGAPPPPDASVPVSPGDAAPSDAGAIDAGGTPPEGPPCGFALSLDGSNYASVPRVVENDFTLEAWIKTTTSRNGNSAFFSHPVFDADIVGAGDNDDFAAGILNDRFVFGVGNPDTTVQGVTTVTTDEWVHVAVTRQGATGVLRVIVNGALDGTAVAPNRNALSAAMTISLGGATLDRKFVGLIDEVRIWNVVRSVGEIASSLRSPLSGSEEGLVGYYDFEDRGPSQTADRSATAQPATLIGNPSYAPSSALCPPQ